VTADGDNLDCSGDVDGNAAGPLTVRWDDGRVLATTTTTSIGTFVENFTVPDDATPGPHTVAAQCDATNDSASATFTVRSTPTLTLTPRSGSAGSAVTADGDNLDCSGDVDGRMSLVELTWDDSRLTEAEADDAGNFSVEFAVPSDTPDGQHEVTARCADGVVGQIARAIFNVLPSDATTLQLVPSTVEAGRTIAVTGERYPDTCLTYTLRLASEIVPFRVGNTVPGAPAGTVVVAGEFDVPESSTAGTLTVELECGAQDGNLLASAVAALTVVEGSPSISGAIALAALLLVVMALVLVHTLRNRRQREWVGEHVRVAPRRAAAEVSIGQVGTARPHTVRLAGHFDAGTQDVEEVFR
jgi:hypothetical protein